MGERGQVTPLLAVVVVAMGGLVFGLARFGVAATDAGRAQTAADAAALAGAAEGSETARALAAANGGDVLTYETWGREVQVRARVGDAWAVARARRTGGAGAGAGVTGWVGATTVGGSGARIAPALRDALEAAAELLHQPVPIAAATGTAVDVPRTFAARLGAVAPRVGLCRSSPQSDPVRFVLCQPTRG